MHWAGDPRLNECVCSSSIDANRKTRAQNRRCQSKINALAVPWQGEPEQGQSAFLGLFFFFFGATAGATSSGNGALELPAAILRSSSIRRAGNRSPRPVVTWEAEPSSGEFHLSGLSWALRFTPVGFFLKKARYPLYFSKRRRMLAINRNRK